MSAKIKKLIIVSIVSILTIGIKAQPYKLFIPGVDYFYSGKGFKIVKAEQNINGDSIYYTLPEAFLYYSNGTSGCIKGQAFSWISPKIIAKPDGTNILFNLTNDTIILKTKANLNESWPCYRFKNGARLDAFVSATDTMTFLGVTDSVKVLSLKYFDSTGNLKPYKLDSTQIILSKNYGLIQTLNFVCFPDTNIFSYVSPFFVMGLNIYQIAGFNNKLGLKNLGQKEIYDYQPGDEIDVFEYYNQSSGNYINQDSIKTKSIILKRTDLKDSIKYQVHEIKLTKHYDNLGEHILFVDSVIWNNIAKQNDYLDQLPGMCYAPDFPQSFIYAPPHLYGSSKFFHGDDAIQYLRHYNDSCYDIVFSDGCPCEREYIKGLGGPYFSCFCFTGVVHIRLVYYKKGSETWGTPLSINPANNLKDNPLVNIYPNPWNSSANITINSTSEGNVTVFDNLGKEVSSTTFHPGNAVINLNRNDYKPGMYFFMVIPKTGNPVAKKFIVE